MPLADEGFDPTEVAVPWKTLTSAGFAVTFATPSGRRGMADGIMLSGEGIGPLGGMLRANGEARAAHDALRDDVAFCAPRALETLADGSIGEFAGLLLPGGHAKGMRPYLESQTLQRAVVQFFAANKPVAAICHGVIVCARARHEGRSVLYGKKTTSLTKAMERLAFRLSKPWAGDYYLTYSETVEDEVTRALAAASDYVRGPSPLSPRSMLRDTAACPDGFTVRDGQYLSARWPGDAHAFANAFVDMLGGG